MKQNRLLHLAALLTLATALTTGCEDAPAPSPSSPAETPAEQSAATPQTQMGRQLTNPYSLSVMQRALDELRSEGGLKSLEALEATHLYIRFAPRDTAELYALQSDTTLELFDYPLDREVLSWGEQYADSDLSEGVLAHQWCVVPVGQVLPEVAHEVLDELYQPEEDYEGAVDVGLRSVPAFDYDALERRAYQLAGVDEVEGGLKRGRTHRPEGNLKYHDNTLNDTIGIEGAKLRFHYFTKVRQDCTDVEGHYRCGSSFRHDPHCEIRWERNGFTVRPNTGTGVAETHLTGGEKYGDFVCQHPTNAWKYASVFRGAHYYFYKDVEGLTRPHAVGNGNNVTLRATNIAPKKDTTGNYNAGHAYHHLPSDIHIFVEGNGSSVIFGTTMHELAHAVHNARNNKVYAKCEQIVTESWARGIEWYFTRKTYSDWIFMSTIGFTKSSYTGVVRSLYNKGFSIKDVEHAFLTTMTTPIIPITTWESVRQKAIRIHPEKKTDIDAAFDYWR